MLYDEFDHLLNEKAEDENESDGGDDEFENNEENF